MLTLIENGDVYAPEPLGRQSVLLVDGKIGKVGQVDRRALEATGLEVHVVDAAGCVVAPGFIDPHEHLLGGSGEKGFSTQTPMVVLSEIVPHGITTVVGVLGVDTTMKTMAGLLARVKALKEEGITAHMWSGGYNVPPTTVMASLREDIMFIDEVIGAGEIAISDHRGIDHDPMELSKLVRDTHVGGMLAGKAGVTHFHVGEEDLRLKFLRDLIDDFKCEPAWLYPTHIERTEKLMDEAIELVARGSYADIDTVEDPLAPQLRYWFDHGGDPTRLTVSSDAGASSPGQLVAQWRDCVVRHGMPLERMLPLVTSNTATVLQLTRKGRLAVGCDGDVVVLRHGSLEVAHVIAGGRHLVADGALTRREGFIPTTRRRIELIGEKQ